jgi:hypothetical protein
MAVVGICTGGVWARFGRVRYRKSEPEQFWRLIVCYVVGGLFLIGYFLYEVYGTSH